MFEAEVAVGARGDAGLMFRVSEASLGTDDYRGYDIGISAEHGTIVFGRSDGAWRPLASAAAPVAAHHPHRLRIEAIGPRVRVWLDGAQAPVLEASDDRYRDGSLGVRTYSDQAHFANLRAQRRR